MRTRYRISVGGTQLDTLNSAIRIIDIQHIAPEIALTVESPANLDGGYVSKKRREKCTVSVTFMILEYDIAKRNTICQAIKTWAKAGGTLATNDRADQALYRVVCEKYPEVDSAKDWTSPLTVTFSAYVFPYWRNTKETVASLTGTNANGKLTVPGNAPETFVSVDITPAVTISWFEVTVAGSTIRVNASIPANNTVNISYDSRFLLTIKRSGTSLLSSRTGTSADDLRAVCGESNNIAVKASGKVTASFKTRGAWL